MRPGVVAVRHRALLDLPEWGGLFVIGMVLMAPLAVIWPFWLLAHAFGLAWTLIVRRERKEVRREERSPAGRRRRDRMVELLEELRHEGGPELPGGATLT